VGNILLAGQESHDDHLRLRHFGVHRRGQTQAVVAFQSKVDQNDVGPGLPDLLRASFASAEAARTLKPGCEWTIATIPSRSRRLSSMSTSAIAAAAPGTAGLGASRPRRRGLTVVLWRRLGALDLNDAVEPLILG
jgi:hypothetical protein